MPPPVTRLPRTRPWTNATRRRQGCPRAPFVRSVRSKDGRNPAGRPLPGQVRLGQSAPYGDIPRGHQAAPGVAAGYFLGCQGGLIKGPQDLQRRVHALPEPLEIVFVHGMVMIVTGQSLVVGEMFFQNPGAQQRSGLQNTHIPGQGVVGIAEDMGRKFFLEVQQHAQIGVFIPGRVVEHAVHQDQRDAPRLDPFHRLLDFVEVRCTGGQQNRFAVTDDLLDERTVGDIRGGYLEGLHQVVEKFGRNLVEGRAEEGHASPVAMHLELFVFVLPESVVFLEQFELAGRGFLGGVPVGGRVPRSEGFGLVGLELDRIGAALGGLVDHAAGKVHVALVIHAHFSDDKGMPMTRVGRPAVAISSDSLIDSPENPHQFNGRSVKGDVAQRQPAEIFERVDVQRISGRATSGSGGSKVRMTNLPDDRSGR